MRRLRTVGFVFALAVLISSLAVEAQQAGKLWRIGYIASVKYPGTAEPFLQRLGELGYVEGVNTRVEYTLYGNRREQLPELTAKLVRTSPNVIVAIGPDAILAAKNATQIIPIVMVYAGDPLRLGIARSLARPSENVTGFTWDADPEHVGKAVEVFKSALPQATRLALLWNVDNQSHPLYRDHVAQAAAALGVDLLSLGIRAPEDFKAAFERLVREDADGLIIFPDPLTVSHAGRILDLASRYRIPTLATARMGASDVLLVYGPYTRDQPSRAAEYVDRILRGEKPGDLPIVQPTRMELIVNLKTVKALGLTIPPSVLLRADQVIE